jgi:hypothetical protein
MLRVVERKTRPVNASHWALSLRHLSEKSFTYGQDLANEIDRASKIARDEAHRREGIDAATLMNDALHIIGGNQGAGGAGPP